jgi:hypothetical protein
VPTESHGRGYSYLGRDQGRETSAGDVAHLVWAKKGQRLVALSGAALGECSQGSQKHELTLIAAQVNQRKLMEEEGGTNRALRVVGKPSPR